jgi:hypothetical protein
MSAASAGGRRRKPATGSPRDRRTIRRLIRIVTAATRLSTPAVIQAAV